MVFWVREMLVGVVVFLLLVLIVNWELLGGLVELFLRLLVKIR